jgi:nicotinate dehydrogenase subunit B
MNTSASLSLSRRAMLRAGGALVVGFVLPAIGVSPAHAAAAKPALLPTEMDSWIAVAADGRVTAFFGKMDMGQGVDVAVAQLVAEELDVDVAKVAVVMGDTALTCDQGGASGSTGIQRGGVTLRAAAAEARRQLLERAAARLGVAAGKLQVADGVVSVNGIPAKQISYADLVGGKYFESHIDWNGTYGNGLTVGGKAPLKPRDQYKVVGQSVPRADVPGKVLGTLDYVTDIKLPNMLHGRMLRPPVAGAVPVSVDERGLDKFGARVIRRKDFIGIVAETEWGAIRAAETVQVKWSNVKAPFPEHTALYDHIRGAKPEKAVTDVTVGNVETAWPKAARMIEAEYQWPFQSHACMGPACALVDVRADGVRAWTGSQKPHAVRAGIAGLLKRPMDSVHVIGTPGPGSYGRNDAGDAAMDAALLSEITGQPVRVQGMRHDGHGWDPKGPPSIHRVRAALDKDGEVIGYEVISKGFSRQDILQAESDPTATLAGMLTGFGIKPTPAFGSPSESYTFANKRLGWETIPPFVAGPSPLRTAHLRDPVGPQIHFASESFIDEIAAATGEDPVAFRLRYLKDPRAAAVIKAASESAGWKTGPAGARRTVKGDITGGLGIAYGGRSGTIVAVVAEVEVNRATGRIWTKRAVVAHDCGLIVNPGGLKLCIEGNVVQGISRAMKEEVTFDTTHVTSTDWNTYPILDIEDAPESVEVILLDHPEFEPAGAGESSIRLVAGAIGNAIFEATGVRLRQAPLNGARFKSVVQALKENGQRPT